MALLGLVDGRTRSRSRWDWTLAGPARPHRLQVTGRLSLVEMAFTFALCLAVLHTSLPPKQQPNRHVRRRVVRCCIIVDASTLSCYQCRHSNRTHARTPLQQPPHDSFAGYAICAVVAAGASLTAVMNPAVSTGLFVAGER